MQKYYRKTREKVIIVRNARELIKSYRRMTNFIHPSEIIVQEIIPGSPNNLFSLGCFFKNNKLVAGFVGKRSRQLPMDFGKISTYVELDNQPKIMKIGAQFLKSLEYYGISEIEFKYDSRDRRFKLLEINPRTWKWHSIGILNGINLPLLLYSDLTKINLEQEIFQLNKTNSKKLWIDIYSDLYVFIKEFLKRKISILQYMNTLKGKKTFGSFTPEDPLPFLIETALLPFLFFRR
ncbi:MAG: hypothetical protein ACW98I_06660 [Candidatus Hodarchaeales archaeon]